MLDLEIVIDVVVGIFIFKSIIAILEFTCLKVMAKFLSKQIKGKTRQERINEAIRLAEEELKKTGLN